MGTWVMIIAIWYNTGCRGLIGTAHKPPDVLGKI
jgi:hypothetical protein